MDDLRNKHNKKRNNNIASHNMATWLKKHSIKIIIYVIIATTLISPEFMGSLIGNWLNILISSFLDNLTF